MSDQSDYAAYLMRHLGKCVVTITFAGMGVGWFAADMLRFSETGQSYLHPWLAFVILLACVGLLFIAMTAVYQVQVNVGQIEARTAQAATTTTEGEDR
jgi:hypothetical protein